MDIFFCLYCFNMAIILPNSTFIRVPRTGSTFVKDVLANLGLNKGELGLSHSMHSDLEGIMAYDAVPFRFCFVRNAVNWYKSYWSYKMTHRWSKKVVHKVDELDVYCRQTNFGRFIDVVYERYPKGFYMPLLEGYQQTCSFVGRCENLREDLIEALHMAGEDFDPDIIWKYPVRNASSKKYSKVKVGSGTITKIKKMEGLC